MTYGQTYQERTERALSSLVKRGDTFFSRECLREHMRQLCRAQFDHDLGSQHELRIKKSLLREERRRRILFDQEGDMITVTSQGIIEYAGIDSINELPQQDPRSDYVLFHHSHQLLLEIRSHLVAWRGRTVGVAPSSTALSSGSSGISQRVSTVELDMIPDMIKAILDNWAGYRSEVHDLLKLVHESLGVSRELLGVSATASAPSDVAPASGSGCPR